MAFSRRCSLIVAWQGKYRVSGNLDVRRLVIGHASPVEVYRRYTRVAKTSSNSTSTENFTTSYAVKPLKKALGKGMGMRPNTYEI